MTENHQLIFGFCRKVAKFQNLLMQPIKPTLKDATDRVLATFYRVCFLNTIKTKKKNQLQVSFSIRRKKMKVVISKVKDERVRKRFVSGHICFSVLCFAMGHTNCAQKSN